MIRQSSLPCEAYVVIIAIGALYEIPPPGSINRDDGLYAMSHWNRFVNNWLWTYKDMDDPCGNNFENLRLGVFADEEFADDCFGIDWEDRIPYGMRLTRHGPFAKHGLNWVDATMKSSKSTRFTTHNIIGRNTQPRTYRQWVHYMNWATRGVSSVETAPKPTNTNN